MSPYTRSLSTDGPKTTKSLDLDPQEGNKEEKTGVSKIQGAKDLADTPLSGASDSIEEKPINVNRKDKVMRWLNRVPHFIRDDNVVNDKRAGHDTVDTYGMSEDEKIMLFNRAKQEEISSNWALIAILHWEEAVYRRQTILYQNMVDALEFESDVYPVVEELVDNVMDFFF